MCNKRQLEAKIEHVQFRLEVEVHDPSYVISEETSFGYDHPADPIVRNETPGILDTDYRWGLIPSTWNRPYKEIWNSTLNAKLEELATKYSFKNITHQRCLVPVTKYFEHHWNDPKGKTKTLYEIWHPDNQIFTLAGLYSSYTGPDGIEMKTYTVLTTEGNERMRFVHNKDAMIDYHRMPVMLNPDDERNWLDTKIPYLDFAYSNYKPRLIAEPVQAPPSIDAQVSMF